MAVPTTLGFIALGLGLFLARPELPPMRLDRARHSRRRDAAPAAPRRRPRPAHARRPACRRSGCGPLRHADRDLALRRRDHLARAAAELAHGALRRQRRRASPSRGNAARERGAHPQDRRDRARRLHLHRRPRPHHRLESRRRAAVRLDGGGGARSRGGDARPGAAAPRAHQRPSARPRVSLLGRDGQAASRWPRDSRRDRGRLGTGGRRLGLQRLPARHLRATPRS